MMAGLGGGCHVLGGGTIMTVTIASAGSGLAKDVQYAVGAASITVFGGQFSRHDAAITVFIQQDEPLIQLVTLLVIRRVTARIISKEYVAAVESPR